MPARFAVSWPERRQGQGLAQRPALVFRPVEATVLELGDDLVTMSASEAGNRCGVMLKPSTARDREHWPLINGVCPLADGTVAASLRSVFAVIIIDRATGDVIWRLGPDPLAQQHCPSELPDGSLLLFDNGTFRAGRVSPTPVSSR